MTAGKPQPLLSVVLPAYNAALTIGEQLQSILSQQCPVPFEIVVVDNKSTDDTASCAMSAFHGDTPLRVVEARGGVGPAYARNEGVKATSAPWLAFVDADDVVAEGWLAAVVDALQTHEFVAGATELDRLNEPWAAASRGRRFSDSRTTFQGIFPYASSCNLGIHRTAFERVGGFDETLPVGEDLDLSLRLWQSGVALHFEPNAIVHYRLRRSLRGLFRQSKLYGEAHPQILERVRESGVATPSRFSGTRTWFWLARSVALLFTKPGRARWLWVAGGLIGRIEGGVRLRRLYI